MMVDEKYFMIQREDGLFSTGGMSPSFNKKGKRWKTRGHVNSHLGQLSRSYSGIYDNCRLVEYTVRVVNISAEPMCSVMADRRKRIEDEKALRQKEWDERRKAERLRLYNDLRKEFEDSQNDK